MTSITLDCLNEIKSRIQEANSIALLADEILNKPEIENISSILVSAAQRRATANAMTKSALVLLCGYFEGFLKSIVEEFISILNDSQIPITAASDQILLSIIESSIQGDKTKVINKLQSIKQNILTSGHLPLDHKPLSSTKGNPTVDTVESIFSKIGIDSVIDKLSIQDFSIDSTYTSTSQLDRNFISRINTTLNGDMSISTQVIQIIEQKWLPRKQRRAVGYVGVIQELLKTRNRIAHGENFGEHVTPSELLDHSMHIEKLCEGLHTLIIDEINSYNQAPPQAQGALASQLQAAFQTQP